jgi:hypothetical protein
MQAYVRFKERFHDVCKTNGGVTVGLGRFVAPYSRVLLLIHFMPDSRTFSVLILLKWQHDHTL